VAQHGCSALRPYYLMVTFWGEKYREYFYSLCLPCLLSPNNLPVLREVKGSKLIICTTKEDWDALKDRPLFEVLKTYVEPFFLEIDFPGPGEPIQLHMSKGHVLAARMTLEDKAFGGFLAPDLLVSDGMVAKVMGLAAKGERAILAPALRFAMEPVVENLKNSGFMQNDKPMNLESRWLASLGIQALHSEILRYDFESPYFGNYPIWCYWRVPNRDALVLHTVSWALLLGSYEDITDYTDNFLESSTIDGFYVYKNFFHLRKAGKMHLITDSDDLMFMSLTPESEYTFYPLYKTFVNNIPLLGLSKRLADIHNFHSSEALDPFRRWAYTVPVKIHGDQLDSGSDRVEMKSLKLVKMAIYRPTNSSHFRIDFKTLTYLTTKFLVGLKLFYWKMLYFYYSFLVMLLDWLVCPMISLLPLPVVEVIFHLLPKRFHRPVLKRLPQTVQTIFNEKAYAQEWLIVSNFLEPMMDIVRKMNFVVLPMKKLNGVLTTMIFQEQFYSPTDSHHYDLIFHRND